MTWARAPCDISQMVSFELGWGAPLILFGVLCGVGCGEDEATSGSAGGPGSGASGGSGAAGGEGGGGAGGGLAWESCYDDLECASVDVPVDYAAPDAATVALRIVRVAAGGERRGSVLLNFGGPGVDGVARVAALAPQLSLGFPKTSDAYDVIGFDWRGVAQSNPLHCLDAAGIDAIRALPYHPTTPAEKTEYEVAAIGFQDACVANNDGDFLASVHTENAARDMDEIRKALGDDQLNYIGISYGTWLGGTYATLFPDKVGAMVLDSPLGIVASRELSMQRSLEAYETALDRFIADCAADTGCAFHGGTDVATVEAALDAVLASVEAGAVDAGGTPLSRTDAAGGMVFALRSGKPQWPAMAEALAAAEGGDGSALLTAADAALFKGGEGYDNFVAALFSISCLDLRFSAGFGFAEMWTLLDQLDTTAPRMGRSQSALVGCIDWPITVEQPEISAASAPPMLMVAGLYDPATPYAGAAEMQSALGNGSHLVTYEGDGHGMLSLSACVRAEMDAFMDDPSSPPSVTSCPAD